MYDGKNSNIFEKMRFYNSRNTNFVKNSEEIVILTYIWEYFFAILDKY